MPVRRPWRDEPRWQHREDNEDVHMRPQVGKLIFKLKNLKFLKEHPDSVPFVIQMLAHHYFVFEQPRPELAYQAFHHLHQVWQGAMGYPSSYEGKADRLALEMAREFEEAQNAVTGDDTVEKLSLSAALREEVQPGVKKQRNNVSPGPSHKSPIAYKRRGEVGFTIPGVEGKFVWQGEDSIPPDMDRVVAVLAAAEIERRSPEIDLTDKGLRRRVSKLIRDHQYDPFERKGVMYPSCTCSEKTFQDFEEWAAHVRKLIWKELKNGS